MRFNIPICAFAALAAAACHRLPATVAIPLDAARADCFNTASGFTWRLVIDRAHNRVDGWPARFGPRDIAWRDGSDGGGYDLDRMTGVLAVTRASSTGGYVILDQCRAAR